VVPVASNFYCEDGGSRFLWNVGNHLLLILNAQQLKVTDRIEYKELVHCTNFRKPSS
jgi:hypothetical protein